MMYAHLPQPNHRDKEPAENKKKDTTTKHKTTTTQHTNGTTYKLPRNQPAEPNSPLIPKLAPQIWFEQLKTHPQPPTEHELSRGVTGSGMWRCSVVEQKCATLVETAASFNFITPI